MVIVRFIDIDGNDDNRCLNLFSVHSVMTSHGGGVGEGGYLHSRLIMDQTNAFMYAYFSYYYDV